MSDDETTTETEAPRCSAMVVDSGAKRRKWCPQPPAFRWQAFERPGPFDSEAARAKVAAKPPASEGHACAMHRDTAHLPDGKSSRSWWARKFSLRLSLIGSVRT